MSHWSTFPVSHWGSLPRWICKQVQKKCCWPDSNPDHRIQSPIIPCLAVGWSSCFISLFIDPRCCSGRWPQQLGFKGCSDKSCWHAGKLTPTLSNLNHCHSPHRLAPTHSSQCKPVAMQSWILFLPWNLFSQKLQGVWWIFSPALYQLSWTDWHWTHENLGLRTRYVTILRPHALRLKFPHPHKRLVGSDSGTFPQILFAEACHHLRESCVNSN